jgi:two-component system, OmpR family, response regulator RstA
MLASCDEWITWGARTEFPQASGIIRSSRKPDPHGSCSDTSMSKRRVLVVDDDVNLSRLAAMILESSGKYDVMVVNQSARALAAAVQFHADALLLDVDMPGLSGGDLAREAARDSRLRDVPILFLTGLLSHEDTGSGPIESGGHQFLAKPVDPQQLLACMESLLPRTAAC